MNRPLAGVLAASTLLVGILAAGLRPDAFFVGDSGVKLVAARNALRFPAHPFEIPLPRIGSEPVPHVEPFFEVHGDHSHAVTSELFPLLSAPLLAAFGLRGLFVLPAVGFLGTLAACAWLGSLLDARRDSALIAATTAAGTPLLFYGLEFWEHALALAAGVAGAAVLVAAGRLPSGRRGDWRPFAAGLMFGTAILLRPEAACFVAAVLVSAKTVPAPPSWSAVVTTLAGALFAWLPLELYGYLHAGSLVPGHIETNAATLGTSWAADRVQLTFEWLVPSRWTSAGPIRNGSFWSVAPAAVIALTAPFGSSVRFEGRTFLWRVALITTALVLITAPNSGGGQWGPRYLLFSYVPLALLAADALSRPATRRGLGLAVAGLALVASLWVQRTAYRQLRGTKVNYGRLADFVAQSTRPGGSVVTDVWWLDQLAAAPLGDRTVLFAGEPSTGAAIVKRLGEAATTSVTVFRSREESSDVDSWSSGSCYIEAGRDELPIRKLVAIRLRYQC